MNRQTMLQHLGEESHYHGAVAPPICQTSLFVFDTVEDFSQSFNYGPGDGFNYSRIANPTNHLAEQKIAMLEHCEAAKLFSSGMAAISAGILSCVKAGDHVVCVDTVYGPTRQFLAEYCVQFGIEVTFVDGDDPEDYRQAYRPNTKLFYLESPSSILFKLQDLAALTSIAKDLGVATMIDNSYSSPWFQQPATFGVDIVVHSASKYLGGFSDLCAGVLCCSQSRMDAMLKNEIALFGGTLAPFPAWLILRSLRVLPWKMKAHEATANEVAAWVRVQPWASSTYHVGFADFPQADLRDRQMQGTGGLFSYIPPQDENSMKIFIEALQIFQLGVSWGGFESLMVIVRSQPIGWPEPKIVLRAFCGLEHAADLIADIEQASRVAGWI